MATRTIRECDRCKHEITSKVKGKYAVGKDGNALDLCQPCQDRLDRFMGGEGLESDCNHDEPP